MDWEIMSDDTEQWEKDLTDRYRRLKLDYNHIQLLTHRLRVKGELSELDLDAMATAQNSIKEEMEKIESDLQMHRILSGED